MEGMFRTIKLVASNPEAGSPYSGGRRRILYDPYYIYYRVFPRLKSVEILAIWHTARRSPKLK
jgi:plasmid stabilization system protein ParE